MGKPNFSFQKRQKELARQKKKEEKKQRKLENKSESGPDEAPGGGSDVERDGEAPSGIDSGAGDEA